MDGPPLLDASPPSAGSLPNNDKGLLAVPILVGEADVRFGEGVVTFPMATRDGTYSLI